MELVSCNPSRNAVMLDGNDPRGRIWASCRAAAQRRPPLTQWQREGPLEAVGEKRKTCWLWNQAPWQAACPRVCFRSSTLGEGLVDCCCEGSLRLPSATSWLGTSFLHPVPSPSAICSAPVWRCPRLAGWPRQSCAKGAFGGNPALLQHPGSALCKPRGCIVFDTPKTLGRLHRRSWDGGGWGGPEFVRGGWREV